ncbi:MAG: lysine--tRNA ligase [Candidatus Altiarchaeales archaeon ex4484_2]|nr:MAG: lysine--tRNA ligase [Candidatus Altiarchaeales archaeon ex4484_2]
MHWSETVARELIERKGLQVIETGTSISGIPHIGNASDVIRGDAIRKVLLERNADVDFIWVADDSDPFRKIPKGMAGLGEYLGFPVKDIPDPDGCHESFVDHYVDGFLSNLKEFGVEPKSYSATELYRSNAFQEGIETVLKRSGEITEILNKFREEPLPEDTVFWSPICENCGRIASTKPTGVDGFMVSYVCQDTEISGGRVKGCGFEGESDIREGRGKLPWRIEWAVRWKHFRVTCEPLGKEHASAGGSFWTSRIISKEILGWEPPIPVIYEFFTLNGEKISSSKGNVITLGNWLDICEPEVLKYSMYKRLKKQRDIKLSSIPALVDEYDRAERVFFGLEEGGDGEGRIYELSQVKKPEKLQVPYTLCAVLSQVVSDLNLDEITKRLERQGYRDYSRERLRNRIKLAGEWSRRYGPSYLNFRLIDEEKAEEAKEQLTADERAVLRKIADELDKDLGAEGLHKRIYEISRESGVKPSGVFRAVYHVLVGKDRGPKAALFILSLDPLFVKNRFK